MSMKFQFSTLLFLLSWPVMATNICYLSLDNNHFTKSTSKQFNDDLILYTKSSDLQISKYSLKGFRSSYTLESIFENGVNCDEIIIFEKDKYTIIEKGSSETFNEEKVLETITGSPSVDSKTLSVIAGIIENSSKQYSNASSILNNILNSSKADMDTYLSVISAMGYTQSRIDFPETIARQVISNIDDGTWSDENIERLNIFANAIIHSTDSIDKTMLLHSLLNEDRNPRLLQQFLISISNLKPKILKSGTEVKEDFYQVQSYTDLILQSFAGQKWINKKHFFYQDTISYVTGLILEENYSQSKYIQKNNEVLIQTILKSKHITTRVLNNLVRLISHKLYATNFTHTLIKEAISSEYANVKTLEYIDIKSLKAGYTDTEIKEIFEKLIAANENAEFKEKITELIKLHL